MAEEHKCYPCGEIFDTQRGLSMHWVYNPQHSNQQFSAMRREENEMARLAREEQAHEEEV